MVSLLESPLPDWLDRKVIVMRAGEVRRVAPAEWPGAFVVLEHGRISIEDGKGPPVELEQGGSFCPPRIRPLTISAVGDGHSVPAAVTRRRSVIRPTEATRRRAA